MDFFPIKKKHSLQEFAVANFRKTRSPNLAVKKYINKNVLLSDWSKKTLGRAIV